jgi:hypothetical protein
MPDNSSGSDAATHENAFRQAVKLGEKQALPVIARSFSEQEVAAFDRRYYAVILGIFWAGALPLLIGLHFAGNADDPSLFLIASACAVLLTVPLWLFAKRKAGARRDYRDPKVTIEAGENSIEYRSIGHANTLSYADIKIISLIIETIGGQKGTKPAVLFLGIVINSSDGPLNLENRYYEFGTRAASVIIAKRDRAGSLAISR